MDYITLPLSKSILNRCLVLSAISGTPINYLPPDAQLPNDVLVMKRLLFENNTNIYNVEDAGTAFRFLTAYLSITEGTHLLYGTLKLNSRPIKPLVDALKTLGAEIIFIEKPGEAPLRINGKKLTGGVITLDAAASSQFVSALMLIAPTFPRGLKIHLKNATSLPYIHITQRCLEYFGVVSSITDNVIEVKHTPEFNQDTAAINSIEADWSSASFWYALCAVTHKTFRFKNLSVKSIQGDVVCVELFRSLGVETIFFENELRIAYNNPVENNLVFNLRDCPDLAPPLIVACALKNITAKFYGLETLQFKESNRTLALQTELKKLNIQFIQRDTYWELTPKESGSPIINPDSYRDQLSIINSHNDHRLAMAFACIKALNNKVEIENPECVKKSYPMFWEEFESITN